MDSGRKDSVADVKWEKKNKENDDWRSGGWIAGGPQRDLYTRASDARTRARGNPNTRCARTHMHTHTLHNILRCATVAKAMLGGVYEALLLPLY